MLREAVVDELIASAARTNGLIGAAVFVPGVDLPILTLNELRLVLRIAIACGREVDAALWPEILAIVGAAFGWRRSPRRSTRPGRRLGGQGRRRLPGHEGDRRGRRAFGAGSRRGRLRPTAVLRSFQPKGGTAMALTSNREAHELLLIEEADAWFEYADATKDQRGSRYAEIEPWAWARLQQRLRRGRRAVPAACEPGVGAA